MTQTLQVQTDVRGVTTLTLDRPARRNALDGHLMAALTEHLEVLAEDPVTRVLLLCGKGTAFCSGADLAWIESVVRAGDDENYADAWQLASLMRQLNAFPKPVVARIHGPARGGGVGLVACCDVAIAAQSATLACGEVRLGLVAAVIAPYILAATGARQARRLLLSGETFSAQQAETLGLVTQVVPDAALDAAVEATLAALLQGEPGAQAQTKQLLRELTDPGEAVVRQTAELTARVRASPVARQHIQAFLKHARATKGSR